MTDEQTRLINHLRAALDALRPLHIDMRLNVEAQVAIAKVRWYAHAAIRELENPPHSLDSELPTRRT